MENIDPIDIIEVEPEPIAKPTWIERNRQMIVLFVGAFLIGLGIGALLVKASCGSVINDYEAIIQTCLLWK